jgi:hypothetical protein
MRPPKTSNSWMTPVCLCLAVVVPARADDATIATKSLTVQPAGIRAGKPGETYLNVEGRHNGEAGKYASFGVLEIPAPKNVGDGGKGGTLSLTLVQSVARFSKPGKLKFYLATGDFETKDAKFDLAGLDGLGGLVKEKSALGSGEFKPRATGDSDTFTLTLNEAAAGYLRARAAKGEAIRLILVPDDEDVAATYFGSGADDAARRPRLKVGASP